MNPIYPITSGELLLTGDPQFARAYKIKPMVRPTAWMVHIADLPRPRRVYENLLRGYLFITIDASQFTIPRWAFENAVAEFIYETTVRNYYHRRAMDEFCGISENP